MNVHVLQHVVFEGLGSMAQWLDAAGLQTSYTRFFLQTIRYQRSTVSIC